MARTSFTARIWLAAVFVGGAVGCYGHLQPPSEEGRVSLRRPALPSSRGGAYAIQGPGGQRGIERFTVTSTGSRWTVRAHRVTPFGREGFVLAVDAATGEPVAVEVWRRFGELRRSVTAHREDDWLVVEGRGLGGATAQRVPYAQGTMIDAPTPVFKAVVLALLSRRLSSSAPIAIRTIRFDGPHFEARVVLSTFEARGTQDGLRLVRLLRTGEGPTGLWVGPDGWPSQMRVVDVERRPGLGRPTRWQWTTVTSTAAGGADVRAPR